MPSPGEHDLAVLLTSLQAELQPGCYVFVSSVEPVPELEATAVMRFVEAEGLTYIVAQQATEALGIDAVFPSAWITLRVHSALAAVGLTAAVARVLAEAGIACNVVAAYHHDHLFVPQSRGAEALALLRQLAAASPSIQRSV